MPALALGAESPEPDVMRQPPRPRRERLLRASVLARVYLVLGPCEALVAMAAFFFVLRAGGWWYGQSLDDADQLYRHATSACLTAIVLAQAVNVFLCRSEHESVFVTGVLGNRLLFAGVLTQFVLLLLIDYHPWGNAIFGTAPIHWHVWLFILPLAGVMLLVDEGRKWLLRRVARTFDGVLRHGREPIERRRTMKPTVPGQLGNGTPVEKTAAGDTVSHGALERRESPILRR